MYQLANNLTKEGFTYKVEKDKEDSEPFYTFTKSFELWGTPLQKNQDSSSGMILENKVSQRAK